MKKIVIIILMVLFTVSLFGCGTKEKLEQKAGEAIAEKALEKAGGGDVDIDGDKVTFKGEDGEKVVVGENEWPTSDLAKNIPEFKGGKVITVVETNDGLFISLEEASKEDFEGYLTEIKKTYTKDVYNMKSEGNVTYAAENDKGIGVTLTYIADGDGTMGITVQKKPQ